MVRVDEVFDCTIGKSYDLNKLEVCASGINYLGMTAKNNGVTAKVAPIEGATPHKGNCIACPLKANVLMATVQTAPFYCTQNMAILRPKRPLSIKELLYYTQCLQANSFRYNFGRNGHLTYKSLLIPSPEEIPDWVETMEDPSSAAVEFYRDLMKSSGLKLEALHAIGEDKLLEMSKSATPDPTPPLDTSTWEYFNLVDLFDLKRGDCGSVSELLEDEAAPPMISASAVNTGICGHYQFDGHLYPANTISIANDGSIGEAFWRPVPYHAQTSVSILIPKFEIDPAIALFIIPILQLEKFRYTYGRKWGLDRMKKTRIKLPTINGNPNYEWMRDYMRTLPFSSCLE